MGPKYKSAGWLEVFGGAGLDARFPGDAVKHPERVTALVLRGIFLLRKKELDFFYEGSGTAFVFPEAWEKYAEVIPADEVERDGYVAAYGKRLRGELGDEEITESSRQERGGKDPCLDCSPDAGGSRGAVGRR